MNDRAHQGAEVQICAHLVQPPDRRYWLDELRLKDFPSLCRLGESADRLQAVIDDLFATKERKRALAQIIEQHGDSDAIKLNLLMVSSFLNHRRSAAVFDVAQESLDAETIAGCTNRRGERDRLALASLMYCQDPARLVAVDLWDRWQSHRRCVHALEGHQRRPLSFAELDWERLATEALTALGVSTTSPRVVLPRREGREVLLGFRSLGDWSNVRTDNGEVIPGREDNWTLLLFYEGGNAVDITASNLFGATQLANALGSQMWGSEVRYTPVRRPLSDRDLRRLLARLTDPEDDTFRLLEMVAAVPQMPDRPIITVSNAEQVRIETVIAEMRSAVPYGFDWNDVIKVKLGFMDQYRVEVHFPRPGEEPVLTYSDVDRNKDASKAFEDLLADELGVVIKPRVNVEMRSSRRPSLRKPKRLTADDYAALLQPVLDRPTTWMLEIFEKLEAEGLVHLRRRAVLRCGDASIGASSGGDTLDCPGEAEMLYGAVDAKRPFVQPEDAVVECSHCGRRWVPGSSALPLFLRVRTTVVHEVAWSRVLERLEGRAGLVLQRPGVAMGTLQNEQVCLVYLPLATDALDRGLGMAAAFRMCWVGRPPAPGYHERGVDLAEILAEGELPVVRAWKLGRDPTLIRRQEPEMPAVVQVQPTQRRAEERRPTTRTVTADDQGIWLDGQRIADTRASGIRMLLAVLWKTAQDDAAGQSPRKARTSRKLASMIDPRLKEQSVYTWVSRLREHLEEVFPNQLDELIVVNRTKGYRLGDNVVCVGFDLSREIAGFEEARRRGEV
jgi:hypothetical protein